MRKLMILLALLTLAGCGGSDPSRLTTTAPEPPVTTTVHGRVVLAEPLANATLRFERPDGTPLAISGDTQTNEAGSFGTEIPPDARDFRVTASRDGEAYATEVRNFEGGLVVVSPLTNLVAARLQTHPGESLEQAQAAVRKFFGMADEADLSEVMVQTSSRPGFQAEPYLEAARAAGNQSQDGVSPFVGSLLQAMDSGLLPNFVYGKDKKWVEFGTNLGISLVTSVAQSADVPFAPVIGWALSLLANDFFGKDNPFAQVDAELAALAAEIKHVEDQVTKEIQKDAYSVNLNTALNGLTGLSGLKDEFRFSLQGGLSYAGRQALAQKLTRPENLNYITLINQDQLGDGLGPGLLGQAAQRYGMAGLSYFCNQYPFDPMFQEFGYFAGQETLATGLVVEGFHSLDPPDTTSARNWYDRYKEGVSLAATAVPQPLPSDDLFWIKRAGILFYRHAEGARTYGEAKKYAAAFKLGGYTGWRVASYADIDGLLGNGGDIATPEQLEGAGLDLKAMRKANSAGHLEFGSDAPNLGGIEGDLYHPTEFLGGLAQEWHGKKSFFLACDVPEAGSIERLLPLGELTQLSLESTSSGVKAIGTLTVVRHKQGLEVETKTFPGLDVTEFVSLSSSDPDILRVQNAPYAEGALEPLTPPFEVNLEPGGVTWLRNGTVTVTATAFQPFQPNLPRLTASLKLSNQNVPAPTLEMVRLGPKEVTLNNLPTVLPLSLLGFFSDGTSEVLKGASFTTSLPAHVEIVTLGDQVNLVLKSNPGPGVTSFTVKGTAQGKSNTTKFLLNLP